MQESRSNLQVQILLHYMKIFYLDISNGKFSFCIFAKSYHKTNHNLKSPILFT
jgi:hypothetical protein